MASGYRNPQLSGSPARRRPIDRQAGVWNIFNRVLTLLVLIGFLVMLGLWFYPELQTRKSLTQNLENKKQELAKEQLLRKQREREKYLLENDPEYIETIARDRLDLMKDGETIFRLDASAGTSAGTPAATRASPPAR